MDGTEKKSVCLDPRTELLLLAISNVVAFTYSAWWIEFVVIAALVFLLTCCKCKTTAIKWLVIFCCLVAFQYYILPMLPKIFVIMFSILTVYVRKLFPCLMIGALIIKTTPVRFLIIALGKWRIPQKMIIPLSITIRYFPAIQEEHRYIRDAMKLRKIKGFNKKLECMVVPLLMSAIGTADELSAAAITRGIENPTKKTCIVDMRFHGEDYLCLMIGCLILALAILIP